MVKAWGQGAVSACHLFLPPSPAPQAPRSPSVMGPPPGSCLGTTLVAPLTTSSLSPGPVDSSACLSVLPPPLLCWSVPRVPGTDHCPLPGSRQRCLSGDSWPGAPFPLSVLTVTAKGRGSGARPAVLLLRKPLPWLPAWVAFVSLCLPPAESPPLSGKMMRRRQERTTGLGGEQETGRQRSRDGEMLAQSRNQGREKDGGVENKTEEA